MSTRLSSPAWLRPTRRAIEWTSLTFITAAILVASTILGWRAIEVPLFIRSMGVAGLAAAAVLGLGDPARPLLEALPTPPIARLGHRVSLLAGATAMAAAVIVASARLFGFSPTPEADLAGALIALTAIGIAVHAILSATVDHANEAAAGVILLWVVAGALPVASLADPVAMAWLNHPSIVIAIAATVTLGVTQHSQAWR